MGETAAFLSMLHHNATSAMSSLGHNDTWGATDPPLLTSDLHPHHINYNDALNFDPLSSNLSLTSNSSFLEFTTLTSTSRKHRHHSRAFPPTSHFLKTLSTTVMPVAICLGVAGNILLFIVFTYTPIRSRSFSHYLAAMGVADLLYLLSCLVVWLLQEDISLYHTIGICQLTSFTLRMSRFLGTWYLFAAHVERFLVHFDSLRTKAWCSTFRTKFIIVTIFIFSLAGYLHYIWTSVVTKINGHDLCMIMRESYTHIRQLVKIEIIAAVFLPMLLIILIDIALVVNVVAKRFKEYFRVNSKNANSKQPKSKFGCGKHGFYQEDLEGYALAPGNRLGTLRADNNDQSSLPPSDMDIDREKWSATIVVAITGLFFIGLLLPSFAYTAWFDFVPGAKFTPRDIATTTLFEHLVKLNSVYKIVLYLIFLRGFRHGLLHLFKCKRRRKNKDAQPLQTTEV